MGFSFIHTSDIHLGRPFSDLSVLTDKTSICNQACNKAFEKIIDLAITKRVDFVLISGDSFDSDEHDLATKLIFIKNLKKLADNNIKSYIICGNHDSVQMYKKYQTYFKFDKKYDGMINITGVTTENICENFNHNDEVIIHSISFETDSCPNPVPILKDCDKNLDKSNKFNIGLIHCDIDKTESKYAPCSREELKSLDYDYYALGHIHLPDLKDDKILYCGSPQGRTKKETGTHGCYYVRVDNNIIIEKDFIPTDFVRFSYLDLDCSNLNNRNDIFNEIVSLVNEQSDEIDLNLFEINLKGITDAYNDLKDTESLIDDYIENFSHEELSNITVYKITDNTKPNIDISDLKDDKGILGLISESFNEDSKIDIAKIYENIKDIHENIYKGLGLDRETRAELSSHLEENREEILAQAQNDIIAFCKEVIATEAD